MNNIEWNNPLNRSSNDINFCSNLLTNEASEKQKYNSRRTEFISRDKCFITESKKLYPNYLTEENDFTHVTNWAKRRINKSRENYVDNRQKLTRSQSNESNKVFKNQGFYGNQGNTNNSHLYNQNETRRSERKTTCPEEIDSCEITLDSIGNRITFPTKTMGNILSSVKEIGYWCPRCYQMYEYGTNSHEMHSKKCRVAKSQLNYKICQLKQKFDGFLNSLDGCIASIKIDNEDFESHHFFCSPCLIYLNNIINVFEKLYNRRSKHFIIPK